MSDAADGTLQKSASSGAWNSSHGSPRLNVARAPLQMSRCRVIAASLYASWGHLLRGTRKTMVRAQIDRDGMGRFAFLHKLPGAAVRSPGGQCMKVSEGYETLFERKIT